MLEVVDCLASTANGAHRLILNILVGVGWFGVTFRSQVRVGDMACSSAGRPMRI